jgi:DNA-binding NarL/FixJ family response regulator
MTQDDTLTVLLVEDDPVDAALFRSLLGHTRQLEQEHASSLGEAIEMLSGRTVDLVVLDLSLPDSDPAHTYQRLADAAPEVAVIVLTGNEDQSVAYEALSDGAQDYLVKNEVTEALLAKSVRYAVERQVAVRRRRRLRVHELEILASIASGSGPPTAGEALADRLPDRFDDLVARYGALLADDSGDEARARGAATLANAAADHGATPADLAAVHTMALRTATSAGEAEEDGSHLLLLHLVGQLASEYRRRALEAVGA